ncbi:MAG: hypothetical protein CSA97_00735, partial [Bacteroidetes bacterium]
IAGASLVPCMRSEGMGRTYATLGGLALMLLALMVWVDQTLPGDEMEFNRKIERFMSLEEKALQALNMPEDTPDSVLLEMVQDPGLYCWEQGALLIDSMESLDLTEEQERTVRLLGKYCEQRIESYRLLYKAISEQTDKYNVELRSREAEIGAVIEMFSAEDLPEE